MAFVITDSCVSCGSCAGECPVGAISQGDGKYEIDANSCIDCGTCAGVCPTGAIEQGQLNTNKNKLLTSYSHSVQISFSLHGTGKMETALAQQPLLPLAPGFPADTRG